MRTWVMLGVMIAIGVVSSLVSIQVMTKRLETSAAHDLKFMDIDRDGAEKMAWAVSGRVDTLKDRVETLEAHDRQNADLLSELAKRIAVINGILAR